MLNRQIPNRLSMYELHQEGNPSSGGNGTLANSGVPTLDKLRLSQDYSQFAETKKLLTDVLVRKPQGQEFLRVHRDPDYQINTMILEMKVHREFYLVARELWGELADELRPVTLFTALNRQNAIFLWPIKVPGADGKIDNWNRSAMRAAQSAMTQWVRVKSSFSSGAYETTVAKGEWGDPSWPESTFQMLIETAFKGKFIETVDHAVIRQLRGEA